MSHLSPPCQTLIPLISEELQSGLLHHCGCMVEQCEASSLNNMNPPTLNHHPADSHLSDYNHFAIQSTSRHCQENDIISDLRHPIEFYQESSLQSSVAEGHSSITTHMINTRIDYSSNMNKHDARKMKFIAFEPEVVSPVHFELLNKALSLHRHQFLNHSIKDQTCTFVSSPIVSYCNSHSILSQNEQIQHDTKSSNIFQPYLSSTSIPKTDLLINTQEQQHIPNVTMHYDWSSFSGSHICQRHHLCPNAYSHTVITAEQVAIDLVQWLEEPFSSSQHIIKDMNCPPPQLYFSKETKGQPLTLLFYKQIDSTPNHLATTISNYNNMIQSYEAINEIKTESNYSTPIQSFNSSTIITSNHDETKENFSQTNCMLSKNKSFSYPDSFNKSTNATCQLCSSDNLPFPLLINNYAAFKITLKFSAGVCLIRTCNTPERSTYTELLVIRRNNNTFYELPKGHLEGTESLRQAAKRELIEETGICNEVHIGMRLLSERYIVKKTLTERLEKSVHYFLAVLKNDQSDPNKRPIGIFGDREEGTRELHWMTIEKAKTAFWKSNVVKAAVLMALTVDQHIHDSF